MKYHLRDEAGKSLIEVDEYNKTVLRQDAGRQVARLLKTAGTSHLTITDEKGDMKAFITVNVTERL